MSATGHMKFIIAGGGTGGHIFPAVAIGHALRHLRPNCELLFVGANGKMEMEKVPKEGFNIVGLDIVGFNRSSLLKNLTLPFKLVKSFLQARSILKSFKPNAVIGVGGYASFPVLYMAQRLGIPTLLQEQNSFAGKSNKILGKKAKSVCVAYDGMEKFFPKDKISLTGNPVRSTIYNSTISTSDAKKFFGLDETKKTVFAFGGSLGAKSINETLSEQFHFILANEAQLLWQTGTTFFEQAKTAVKGFERHVKVHEFIREMDYAYAAADVIIARAGASSISELCLVGKPVVFVPFPFASEDHQTHNAMSLVSKDAALIVKDSDVKHGLMNELDKLLKGNELNSSMRRNILTLGKKDADLVIAQKVLEIAK